MYNKKELRKLFSKYRLYSVIVVILYILSATPGFLQFFGIKPCLVVPFCIALALCEEDFLTMIIYALGGLLVDVSAGRISGFFTIPLVVLCIACMLGVKFVFTADSKSAFAFSFVTMFILRNIDFIFNYLLFGYGGLTGFYIRQVIIHSRYSALFGIPFYFLVNKIMDYRPLKIDARWKA